MNNTKSDKPNVPEDVYNAMVGLWNAVYTEYKLFDKYYELCNRFPNAPIEIDMILKALPHELEFVMRECYHVIHKYNKKG